jgi:hypothetical protein
MKMERKVLYFKTEVHTTIRAMLINSAVSITKKLIAVVNENEISGFFVQPV